MNISYSDVYVIVIFHTWRTKIYLTIGWIYQQELCTTYGLNQYKDAILPV